MERSIRPQVPAMAKMTAVIDQCERFSTFAREGLVEAYWTGRRKLSRPRPNSLPNALCVITNALMRRRGRGRRW